MNRNKSKTVISPEDARNVPHPDAQLLYELEPRNGSRTVSFVWRYFHQIVGVVDDDDDDNSDARKPLLKWKAPNEYAACNCCGSVLKAKGARGWTAGSIQPHLLSAHQITPQSELDREAQEAAANASATPTKRQASLHESFTKSIHKKIKTHLQLRDEQIEATAVWVAGANQPLSSVEDPLFRGMISSISPSMKPITTRNVKERIIDLDRLIRKTTIAKMKGCVVNLTTDHWTSKQHLNYVGMTAHWLDSNWELHSLPLGMFLHEGGSNAMELLDQFLETVAREVTEEATIFSVTTDTAPTMNTFGRLLEDKKILHLYCTDHLLQLTCKKTFDLSSFGDVAISPVQKATDIVSHFQSSTQATEKLIKAQSIPEEYSNKIAVRLFTDCKTRWWSTYKMCERILYLKSALHVLEASDDIPLNKRLSDADWEQLEAVTKVLKPFRDAQLSLEGEQYVSSSYVVPHIYNCRQSLEAGKGVNNPECVRQLSVTMSEDFNLRWGGGDIPIFDTGTVVRGVRFRQIGIHPAFVVATFLHPSLKSLNGMGVSDGSKVTLYDYILDLMVDATVVGNDDSDSDNSDDDSNSNNQEACVVGGEENAMTRIMQENVLLVDDSDSVLSATDIRQGCEDELLKYKRHVPRVPIRNRFRDPIAWWKKYDTRFPRLAALAHKYLSIQATSAPSERIFSLASRIIEDRRTRLDPSLAGQLLYVGCNYKWYMQQIEE